MALKIPKYIYEWMMLTAHYSYKTVEVEFSDYGEVKVVKDERPAALEKWNLRTHH